MPHFKSVYGDGLLFFKVTRRDGGFLEIWESFHSRPGTSVAVAPCDLDIVGVVDDGEERKR